MKTIRFYRTGEAYGEFSNFSAHPIELAGVDWPTTEHYFQAQKFPGSCHAERIRAAKSPMIAARLGRSREHPLRADWETEKENIMRAALRAKFTQYPHLRSLLLRTGDAELVEHTSNDRYWADGGDGSGRNRLGQLLMELRRELRRDAQPANPNVATPSEATNQTAEDVVLFRPVGPQELALIAESGWRAFPPRLAEQPFFYPVLNEDYARQIARDWNVPASGHGYVTRFRVRQSFINAYATQTVGSAIHRELWIPAEHLPQLNENLVGRIEVIAEFGLPDSAESHCAKQGNQCAGS